MGEQQIDWHRIWAGIVLVLDRIGSDVATWLDYANRFIARSVSDSRCIVLATGCGWLCSAGSYVALSLRLCLVWLSLSHSLSLLSLRGGLSQANLLAYFAVNLSLWRFFGATMPATRPSLPLPLPLFLSLSYLLSWAVRVCVCDLNSNSKRIAYYLNYQCIYLCIRVCCDL